MVAQAQRTCYHTYVTTTSDNFMKWSKCEFVARKDHLVAFGWVNIEVIKKSVVRSNGNQLSLW